MRRGKQLFLVLLFGMAAATVASGNWLEDLLEALFADQAAFLEVQRDFEQRRAAKTLNADEIAEYQAFVDQLRGQVEAGCSQLETSSIVDLPAELPCEFAKGKRPTPNSPTSEAKEETAGSGESASDSVRSSVSGDEEKAAGAGEAENDGGEAKTESRQARAGDTGARERETASEDTNPLERANKPGERTGQFSSPNVSHLHIGEDAFGHSQVEVRGRTSRNGRFAEGSAVERKSRSTNGSQTGARWNNSSGTSTKSGEQSGNQQEGEGVSANKSKMGSGSGKGDLASASGDSSKQPPAGLDARFETSLDRFDALLLQENARVKAAAPIGGGDSDVDSTGEGGEAGRPGVLTDADIESERQDAQAKSGSRSGQRGRGGGGFGGTLGAPSNRSSGRHREIYQGEDIVARQVREAAERETDPKLKAKLWEEYRKLTLGGQF